MELRPYQKECLAAIEAAGTGRHLCQLATGLGKTVIFANIPLAGRELILSHREELVRQPLKYFACKTGIEMASERPADNAQVVSASVQTMARRMEQYSPAAFDTVIVDEAHHAASPTYQKILAYFRPRRVLGFTATPNRADGVGLESAFDEIIFQRDLRWGIEQGYLSKIYCKRVNIGYDLAGVASRMGDYAPGDLERAVNIDKCNDAIAEIVENLAEKPVLIFAVDVAHAESIAAAICKKMGAGYAKALSAQSRDRAEVVADFKAERVPVLVNCALFTEGTDLPNTRTVIIARPTKSNALYTQMVGRGTRLAEGKDHCLLVDCVGVSNQPLCTAPSLLGLDLDSVPRRYRQEIEGDLLAEIPALIETKADTPESWINNIQIVDLWATAQGYNLHDVNYQKRPDGSLSLTLPEHKWVHLTAPDLTGKVIFRTSGGYRAEMEAQKAYDRAFECLRGDFADCKPLWDVHSVKRWGAAPANEKQIDYIKRLSRRAKIDVSGVMNGLTKMQASNLISRLI